jgi:hypothetical protein
MKYLKGFLSVVMAAMFVASSAFALPVNFDLTRPGSSIGATGRFADSYSYQLNGLGLNVSGISNGGDFYGPLSGMTQADVGWSRAGLGVESRGLLQTVDNAGWDYDFLVFSFDRQVTLGTVGLGYISESCFAHDSDVSVGAFMNGSLVSAGNIFDANYGNNSANGSGYSSDVWLVGAYHPYFGAAQDNYWDSFRIDSIGVNVAAVPLPAAIWFMVSGLVAMGAMRRRRSKL